MLRNLHRREVWAPPCTRAAKEEGVRQDATITIAICLLRYGAATVEMLCHSPERGSRSAIERALLQGMTDWRPHMRLFKGVGVLKGSRGRPARIYDLTAAGRRFAERLAGK